MSVVLLVRHGQATFGLGTYDRLSEHGQAQALRLATVLAERGIAVDRIVCGNLERQRETAEILAGVLTGGAPVTVDPTWDEYDHARLIARVRPAYRKHWLMVADLARSGNPGRKLQEIIDEALAQWVVDDELAAADPVAAEFGTTEGDADAGESFSAYQRRLTGALDAVTAREGTTVVVSSAGTITAAVAPLLGVPPASWPGFHRVMVNTSVTKVVRGRSGISLVSFNAHGHLEGVSGLKITYR